MTSTFHDENTKTPQDHSALGGSPALALGACLPLHPHALPGELCAPLLRPHPALELLSR